MNVHHINCATMCPASKQLVNGEGGLFERGRMVCHCLIVETRDGIVLIDTGLGTGDCTDPKHLGKMLIALTAPRLDIAETALRQIERLGYKQADVRHIVPTHLDLDHAGGLPDFPKAKVHLYRPEHTAAMARATLHERERYKPKHWAHEPSFVTYETRGERWFGFDCVRELDGLPPEILIVPVVGHTRGHAAIAVDTGKGWLLHAGDAYFFHGEMDAQNPRCTPALAGFQRVIAMDNDARLRNQARLRELARDHHGEVTVFSAHDPVEFERFQGEDAALRAA
jgi:glyoxylase-like metal-dependent hydrolase (beta-lactamase superfamily II)